MNDTSIHIETDEWRSVVAWMYLSLDSDESSPYGHFLLECEGTRRTWIATDTTQMTVLHGSGTAPTGLDDPRAPFAVRINPRLFRNRPTQDATLVVRREGDDRMLSLISDGVTSTLPEHSGDRAEWRPIIDGLPDVVGRVDTAQLREACATSMVVPFGLESPNLIGTWMSVVDDQLVFETGWGGLPATAVSIPVDTSGSTAPTLVDIRRLFNLVEHIDLSDTDIRIAVDGSGPMSVQAGDYLGVVMPIDPVGTERHRLEELLCEFLHVDSVSRDGDGDYPVTIPDGSELYVRLMDGETPTVQVFAVLASPVHPSAGLYEELNAINAASFHVKVIHASDAVMTEVDLVAETLDQAELANALRTVVHTRERYRGLLSAFFTPSESTEDDQP